MLHALSYLSLGVFFEVPELSLNALCLFWARNEEVFISRKELIIKFIKIRYVLTHYVAPCAGISSIITGMHLTAGGGYSYREGWLFWILMASVIGLYKGLYQHNGYVKYLLNICNGDAARLRRGLLSPYDQSLIFMEFPTYVFNFWAAAVKPLWLLTPAVMVGGLEKYFGVWGAGVIMLGAGSLLLVPLYFSRRRLSPSLLDPASFLV